MINGGGEFGPDFFRAAVDMAREPLDMFLSREVPQGGNFLPTAAPALIEESPRIATPAGGDFMEAATGMDRSGGFFDRSPQDVLNFLTPGLSKGEDAYDLFSQAAANARAGVGLPPGREAATANRKLPPQVQGQGNYPAQASRVGPGAEPPNTASPWFQVAVNTALAAGMSQQDAEVFGRQMSWESGGFSEDVISGRRRSSAGAQGIAQIMPQYHPGVNPLNPNEALQYAARLMTGYLRKYGSMTSALIAYNAGEGTVGSEYIPGETRQYLLKILGDQSQLGPAEPVTGGPTTGQGTRYRISFDYGAKYDTPIISDITGQPVTYHRGVDLIVPGAANNGRGLPIQPFVAGTVVNVGHAAAAGNYVVIQDGEGQYHWYMHLDSALVGNGQTVDGNTTIGTLGGTATESFPHLHYEVRTGSQNGTAIDPRMYLR